MSATLKTVHVMSACLFLGNVIVSGTWAALAERTRDHKIISFSNRMVLITDLLFTLTGALGVVLTGTMMALPMARLMAVIMMEIMFIVIVHDDGHYALCLVNMTFFIVVAMSLMLLLKPPWWLKAWYCNTKKTIIKLCHF